MGHEKEIQENGEIAAIEHYDDGVHEDPGCIINKIDTLKPLPQKKKISAPLLFSITTLVLTMQRCYTIR